MASLVLLVVLGWSNLVGAQTDNVKSIFILAGQSNMAGRGGMNQQWKWDGIVPPQDQPNPNILRLNASWQWEEAHDPLHEGIDLGKPCGIGPGMSFSNRVLKEMNPITIGLVPCAIGGTTLNQWSPGAPAQLYNNMVNRARKAVSTGGQIRALLWYQGEGDANNQNDAQTYKTRLQHFITTLRSDLQLPMLPVVMVALGTNAGPYTGIIRQAQLGLNLTNVVCVDALGLKWLPDKLHLNTEAEVKLGEMMAEAFLKSFAHKS